MVKLLAASETKVELDIQHDCKITVDLSEFTAGQNTVAVSINVSK